MPSNSLRASAQSPTAWLWAWGPVLAWMAAIFTASSRSNVEVPLGAPDYVGHAIGYAILGALLVRALTRGRLNAPPARLILTAFVIAVLYGVSDEWHQSFVPGRYPSLSDVLADGVGGLVGAALASVVGRILRR